MKLFVQENLPIMKAVNVQGPILKTKNAFTITDPNI